MLDARKLKADFPLLADGRLTYLDSAATAQKPAAVLEAMDRFYRTEYANPHRGVHGLGEAATSRYESARQAVAGFIGASPENLVFTRGTTDSLNLFARGWAAHQLKPGDTILLTEMEHHANQVPWFMLAKEKDLTVEFVGLTDDGRLERADFEKKLAGASLLSMTHVSNVLGTVNPVADLVAAAQEHDVVTVIDAAQAAPHLPLDVGTLGADAVAFSAHKLLGPTGIGALWARPGILEQMQPVAGGGQMIREVSLGDFAAAEPPYRFEAGTMPVAEAVGFEAAVTYVSHIGMQEIANHESALARQAAAALEQVPGVTVYGPDDRAGIVSFTVDGVHAHDLASLLDEDGIAIRSGHHCAQPLHEALGVPATARASFSVYNEPEDAGRLVDGIRSAQKTLSGVSP